MMTSGRRKRSWRRNVFMLRVPSRAGHGRAGSRDHDALVQTHMVRPIDRPSCAIAATIGKRSWKLGAAGGDRTHDPWLRRPILYPLSYSRIKRGECALSPMPGWGASPLAAEGLETTR